MPSPNRLQEMLALRAFSVSRSRLARGKSRCSRGRNSRERPSIKPQRFMMAMIPVHRQRMPPMETHSSTAAVAPSMAAADTSAIVPLMSPKTRDSTTMPVQTQAIAIRITSSHCMRRAAGSYWIF